MYGVFWLMVENLLRFCKTQFLPDVAYAVTM